VHNVRIERLWVDYNSGFTNSWYQFFHDLELAYGLNHEKSSHIWLVHFLFLPTINEEARLWTKSWNQHKIRGERNRSPEDLFMFGLMEEGTRGIGRASVQVDADEQVEDYASYGVDWEFLNVCPGSDVLDLAPHLNHLPGQGLGHGEPEVFNEVRCDPPNCPLAQDEVGALTLHLEPFVVNWGAQPAAIDGAGGVIEVRKALWASALNFCQLARYDGF
jgi:hypothetical protein